MLHDKRHETIAIFPTHTPYENNLHHIVNDFIKGDYDFWLNMDSDNPPMNNPLDLVKFDLDVIGCPTPVWHYDIKKPDDRPFYWNVYEYVKDKDAYKEYEIKQGLQEVDAVGTGCVLYSRRVFENKAMQNGCFNRKLNKDGTVNKGNDISFCERAKEQGFNIFAHYGYPCMHFNEVELTEVIKSYG